MEDQPMTRTGYFSCDLVPHPEGHFQIGGALYRPEWGRPPSMATHEELVKRMVAEGVRVGTAHYDLHNTLPERIHVEALDPEGVLTARIAPRTDWKIISFKSW